MPGPRPALRLLAATALALLLLNGCRGETKVEDSPQTLAALDSCRRTLDEKDGYIRELEQRLAKLESEAAGGEVTVTVTGDQIEISGKGPSELAGAGDASDKELYQAFLDQVQGARGAMKKCYQSALKKNTALQARTITIQLEARFTAAGKVSRASFTPAIDESFDACMRGITTRWALPAAPQGYTFRQPITLSPQ